MKKPEIVCTIGSAVAAPVGAALIAIPGATVVVYFWPEIGLWPEWVTLGLIWFAGPVSAILTMRNIYRWCFRHCRERVTQ